MLEIDFVSQNGKMGSRGPVFSFYNIYLDSRIGVPVSVIGTVMAISSLLSIPAILTAPALARKVGRVLLVKISMIAVAGGCALLSVETLWTAALAYVVVTAALGAAAATNTAFSQEIVGRQHRAVMSGFMAHATALSWAIMTFGGGVIIDVLSYKTLFMCAALLPMVSVGIYSALSFGRVWRTRPAS